MTGSLKSVARFGLHQAGGLHLLRLLRRKGLRILTYHRFSDAEAWEQQCRHLRDCYQPVTLRSVYERWLKGQPLPPQCVVVTVDDGYRDFYTHGYPIAKKYGIPATVFLVSDFLDGRLWMWWDAIQYALQHSPLNAIPDELLPCSIGQLHSPADRTRAARRIVEALKLAPDSQRREFIARLGEIFQVALPSRPTPAYEPLTWDEVREMSHNEIEFGAHTKTHPILPRVESMETLTEELRHPKLRLEQELQQAVPYFCYPNGDWDQRCLDGLQAAGYGLAVTTQWGRNLTRTSPYLLERCPADPSWPAEFFRETVAYGYPWRKQAS